MAAALPALILGTALVVNSIAAHADRYLGDAARGRAISASCVSCHEGHGRSTGTALFPRIGGQNYAYLYISLREYRDGQRSRGWARTLMADSVKGLSDDELKDIARYFAELPW
ncbi:MAG: c-type cytochrome [Burkholderiales bacterium]